MRRVRGCLAALVIVVALVATVSCARTEDEDTRSPFVVWGIGRKKYEAGARFASILTGPRDLGPVQPWAWTAVMATVLIMSSTSAPRDRSLTGLFRPWRTGPMAIAPDERWTAL